MHSIHIRREWNCSLPSISCCWQSFSSTIAPVLSLVQSITLLACSLDASPYTKCYAVLLYFLRYCTIRLGFPAGSEVKASAWNEGDPGSIPGWEDPLEKEMATHSSTLAWRIPWTEEPGRLQSMGSQRVGHDWVTSLSLSFTIRVKLFLYFL